MLAAVSLSLGRDLDQEAFVGASWFHLATLPTEDLVKIVGPHLAQYEADDDEPPKTAESVAPKKAPKKG